MREYTFNALKYWNTKKPLNFHLGEVENNGFSSPKT